MSDSLLYSDYIATRQRVDQLERVEKNATYLTLRRTTTQSLTTAGTIVSWDDVVRNVGFTWSAGTTISIPQDGYYAIDMAYSFNLGSVVNAELLVGGIATGKFNNFYGSGTVNRISAIRYFATGDSVEVRLTLVSNRTLQAVAYGSAGESPFIHIVRIA